MKEYKDKWKPCTCNCHNSPVECDNCYPWESDCNKCAYCKMHIKGCMDTHIKDRHFKAAKRAGDIIE